MELHLAQFRLAEYQLQRLNHQTCLSLGEVPSMELLNRTRLHAPSYACFVSNVESSYVLVKLE